MKEEEKSREELIAEIASLRMENDRLNKRISTRHARKSRVFEKTVLIVDDNQETRNTVGAMVEGLGYKTLLAESAPRAIELVTQQKASIDLILSDIVMPDGGGSEMANQIIKLKPDIKVIFMSGYAEEEIVHDDVFKIQNSCTEFIQKPFSMEEIGTLLKQQLGK
jgi:two-component system cell cycle sensor histidine kinase/response regulator CckA